VYRKYPAIFLKRLRKTIETSFRTAGRLAKIQAGFSPNTRVGSNYYINLPSHIRFKVTVSTVDIINN
jgi:hypothetical protein